MVIGVEVGGRVGGFEKEGKKKKTQKHKVSYYTRLDRKEAEG